MSQNNVTLGCEKGPYLLLLCESTTDFVVTTSCREGKNIGTHIYDQGCIDSVIYGVQVCMSHWGQMLYGNVFSVISTFRRFSGFCYILWLFCIYLMVLSTLLVMFGYIALQIESVLWPSGGCLTLRRTNPPTISGLNIASFSDTINTTVMKHFKYIVRDKTFWNMHFKVTLIECQGHKINWNILLKNNIWTSFTVYDPYNIQIRREGNPCKVLHVHVRFGDLQSRLSRGWRKISKK